MASTNKTAHYDFPQYIGSDVPNILTDINPAFETIDTALYEQGQQIAEQTTDLSDIQEAVDQATADVAVMQSSIVQMAGIVETTRQLATDNKETIGQGTLDTTAQTLIGGVNELNSYVQPVKIASVTGDGTKSYTTLLNELHTALNGRKLSSNAYMITTNNGAIFRTRFSVDDPTTYAFTGISAGETESRIMSLDIAATGSRYSIWRFNASGNTEMNYSSTAYPNGATIDIYDING